MESPGFSKFRALMDLWDECLAEQAEDGRIRRLLELQGFVLYFKKGKDYYGAGEDSRVVFARLKNPDDETPEGWSDEADFSAANLGKLLAGEPSQHLFGKDDLKKIKVVDQSKVIEALRKSPEEKKQPVAISVHLAPGQKDPAEAPNLQRTDEE